MLKGIKWCSRHLRRLVLNRSIVCESILSSRGDLRALVLLRLLRMANTLTFIVSLFLCHTTLCPAAEGRHAERGKQPHLLTLRLRLPDRRLLSGGESLLLLLLGGLPDGDLPGAFLLLTRPVEALDTDLLDALLCRRFGGLPDGNRLCLLESPLLSPSLCSTFSLLTCPFSCASLSPALVSSFALTASFLSPLGSASGAPRSAPPVSCDACPFCSSEMTSGCPAPAAFAALPIAPADLPSSFGLSLTEAEPLPCSEAKFPAFGRSLLAFFAEVLPLDSFALAFCGAGLFLRL